MKKGFLKSVVAAAVVTAAVALSSVAAFAATTVYNVSNLTNDSVSSGTELTFSDVVDDDANITWGGGGGTILTDGPYTGAAPDGVKFTKRIRPTGGNRSISITLPASATVDFYVCTTNGSDAAREAVYTLTGEVMTYKSDTLSNASGKEVVKVSYTVDTAGTYTLTTSKDRLTLFGIVVTTSDGPTVYWPTPEAQTSSVSGWIGGEATNLSTGNKVANGATNNGGKDNNSNRIRIGKDAHTDSGEATPTIASCGYITFEQEGSFIIDIKAASSGETSSRDFYLGTFDGTNFTDIKELTVTGNVGENVDYTVNADGTHTYAIYVKPYTRYNEEAQADELLPAENTDIQQIDIYPVTAVKSVTPEVTLDNAAVADGQLTITATFNDFSGSLYQVDSITLNAASGKDTQAEAVWTANDIIYLKDNGDGTVSFTATCDDPGEDARFQVIAHYVGVDTATADVDTNAVSNLVGYDASEVSA